MLKFRLIGGSLLASAAIVALPIVLAQAADDAFMKMAKDYVAAGGGAGHDLDRPDHRSEGARQEAGHLRLGRPEERRRAGRRRRRPGGRQGDRLGLPHPRRAGLGPGALVRADPGDRAEARRHHSRHDRRRRAGADHRAGGRGRRSRSSVGTPAPAPARSTEFPASSPTSPPIRSRSPRRPVSTPSSIRAARPTSSCSPTRSTRSPPPRPTPKRRRSRDARAARCCRSRTPRSAISPTAWVSSPRRCSPSMARTGPTRSP